MKFTLPRDTFTIKIEQIETGSNYNQFVHVFKNNEKTASFGGMFKYDAKPCDIKAWAKKRAMAYKDDETF